MDTTTAVMAIITGVLLPLVTGLLTKAQWAEWIKFLIVVLVAAIVGTVELALKGVFSDFTWDQLYSYLGMVYVASGASFWLLVDSTGLRDWLYEHGVK